MPTGQYTRNPQKPRDLQGRFWSSVNKNGPIPAHCPELGNCWEWTLFKTKRGYGSFAYKNKSHRAHRVAWELTNGEIPDGLFVLHKCDNCACCNPDHLFLGTHQDNMDDMKRKARIVPSHGEKNGQSKLTIAQVESIRRRYAAGNVSSTELANEFGVARSTMRSVINHKSWKTI